MDKANMLNEGGREFLQRGVKAVIHDMQNLATATLSLSLLYERVQTLGQWEFNNSVIVNGKTNAY